MLLIYKINFPGWNLANILSEWLRNSGKAILKKIKIQKIVLGSTLPDPNRRLRLQGSFRKSVSVKARSAPEWLIVSVIFEEGGRDYLRVKAPWSQFVPLLSVSRRILLLHRCGQHKKLPFTRTIKLKLFLKWLLGSNLSQLQEISSKNATTETADQI